MGKLKTVKDLFGFMWKGKKLWMFPLVFLLMLLGLLIVFTQGSALAPFIYTIF